MTTTFLTGARSRVRQTFFFRTGHAALRIALMVLAAALLSAKPARAQDFLPVDQAFQVQAQVTRPGQIAIGFKVAPGTYLYRERLEARLDGTPPTPLALTTPDGERKHDPTFDKVMEVYHHDVAAAVAVPDDKPAEGAPPEMLAVVYQGCADAGLCYPPQTRRWRLTRDAQGRVTDAQWVAPQVPAAPKGGNLFGGSRQGSLFGGSQESGPAQTSSPAD